MDDTKAEVEKLLTPDLIYSIYVSFLGEGKIQKGKPHEYIFKCPFHDDKNASFGIDASSLGRSHCFGCDKGDGNIYTFLKSRAIESPLRFLAEKVGLTTDIKKTISPGVILEAKETLKNTQKAMEKLYSFGITESVIEKYNLGFSSPYYYFPVQDEMGDFVNIRKYCPGGDPKVMSWGVGYGESRLWPLENLNEDTVYIFEGEKDCLVALSLGYNAMTVTGGATTWNSKWNHKFKNKNVVICMDVDEAGKTGALKKAKELYNYAAQVKVITLPIPDPDKFNDFCDYISHYHNGKIEFDTLVEQTAVYFEGEATDDSEYKCMLAEASRPQYVKRRCDIRNVIICGRDGSPFVVPKKVTFECGEAAGKQKQCILCQCSNNGSMTINIAPTDYLVPEMVNNPAKIIEGVLRKKTRVCQKAVSAYEDFYTVDRIRMSPNTSYNIEEDFKHVIRTGIYVTDQGTKNQIETNKNYNIHAITVPDPKTQYVMHQIYDISDADTSTDNFTLDDITKLSLNIFRAEPGKIQAKLDDIYGEYEAQSRIYGRQDLFLMYDLTFFSAITFDFQGQGIGKGWVECCAVGDSGTGKTSVVKFLVKQYRAGEVIDGETCTEVGLKGGLQQIGGQWQLQWGRLPLSDKKLVVIDEASGLSVESIAAMSNIRSSGECIIQKVISDKTRSRTRIIWISNPRKQNTGIVNYVYGVETIKDFFGKPEDVRRCDVAMTVASGEIPLDVINSKYRTIVPKYTADLSHNLIKFAWSLKSENILLTQEAEELILEMAKRFGKKYSPIIPLVEASDIRNKIARLSVALAIRLFNINENNIVIVEKEHVEYISWWLDSVYSKPRMQYDKFSEKENKKLELVSIEEIDEMFRWNEDEKTGLPTENIKKYRVICDLLDSAIIENYQFARILDETLDSTIYRNKVMILKHAHAITFFDRRVKINPCFIDYLRKQKDRYEKVIGVDKPKFNYADTNEF